MNLARSIDLSPLIRFLQRNFFPLFVLFWIFIQIQLFDFFDSNIISLEIFFSFFLHNRLRSFYFLECKLKIYREFVIYLHEWMKDRGGKEGKEMKNWRSKKSARYLSVGIIFVSVFRSNYKYCFRNLSSNILSNIVFFLFISFFRIPCFFSRTWLSIHEYLLTIFLYVSTIYVYNLRPSQIEMTRQLNIVHKYR